MAFFDKLNSVAKSAAKSAADLANDAIGSGKIAVKIKREEMLIEQQYEKIGEYFYKMRNEGMEMPSELEECCVAIDVALATIKELEEARSEMRDSSSIRFEDEVPYAQDDRVVRTCPSCGADVDHGAVFCTNCGSKLSDE